MKITGMITNRGLKRRISWFVVLMVWVGMVTAVVIHRSPDSNQNLAEISQPEGYVKVEEVSTDSKELAEDRMEDVLNFVKGDNSKNKGKDFFVEYRIERDQARSEQINLLREMINNPNSDKKLKTKAQERLLTLTNNIEKEMEIESLIRARGYNDGIAFIHDNSIELIISTEALQKEDVAKLGDIIKNSTEINLEDITIIEKKPE